MAATKRSVPIQYYGSQNRVEIFKNDAAVDGYEFHLYLHSTYLSDTHMTRDQATKLRDALNELLET